MMKGFVYRRSPGRIICDPASRMTAERIRYFAALVLDRAANRPLPFYRKAEEKARNLYDFASDIQWGREPLKGSLKRAMKMAAR